jgi:hypothetical protein
MEAYLIGFVLSAFYIGMHIGIVQKKRAMTREKASKWKQFTI